MVEKVTLAGAVRAWAKTRKDYAEGKATSGDMDHADGILLKAVEELAPPIAVERNQCDGCSRGDVAGSDGFHRDASGRAYMTCQRDRYVPTLTAKQLSGGKWLGAARSWLQWHKRNGSDVTWGSQDVLVPHMTAADVDALAAEVAATFQPEGPPKSVMEAAEVVVRWHYGEGTGSDGQACVLVDRKEWHALRDAVETAKRGVR